MKTRSILLSAILMTAITPAFAQATSGTQGTKMNPNMQNMPMHPNDSDMKMMNCMQMHQGMKMDKNMPMGKNMRCANQTAQGTGVIEAVDTAKSTVTIKHQAIASIHWPAMTMTFKVDPPALLQKVKVGEQVQFTLHPAGMASTVTAISPAG
ncbi:copper-binding protein [Rhodanobacter sp. 115]|uniref:copper-binding protein n=1 Tax=Rhodanobacter sp. FW021-MT20 TaxID=1162282 RepID=UPI000260F4CE|nr:copper-binding protein [Rhodanobacter sp. 115]EIL94372.1 Copper binding periplasmic protein CusF [Rhodanobacter sp. 115]